MAYTCFVLLTSCQPACQPASQSCNINLSLVTITQSTCSKHINKHSTRQATTTGQETRKSWQLSQPTNLKATRAQATCTGPCSQDSWQLAQATVASNQYQCCYSTTNTLLCVPCLKREAFFESQKNSFNLPLNKVKFNHLKSMHYLHNNLQPASLEPSTSCITRTRSRLLIPITNAATKSHMPHLSLHN